jgi:hypothetical protein
MTEPLNSTKAADLIQSQTGRRCSRQNLEKLCRAGRLPNSCVSLKPIRVRPETLVEEYLHNVDPRQQTAAEKPAPARRKAEDLKSEIDSLPPDEIPGFNESRSRREHYLAEKARLEVQTMQGDLVPAADVKAAAFKKARTVRDSMMAIPDRVIPTLISMTDTRAAHQLLTEEIRTALRSLAGG